MSKLNIFDHDPKDSRDTLLSGKIQRCMSSGLDPASGPVNYVDLDPGRCPVRISDIPCHYSTNFGHCVGAEAHTLDGVKPEGRQDFAFVMFHFGDEYRIYRCKRQVRKYSVADLIESRFYSSHFTFKADRPTPVFDKQTEYVLDLKHFVDLRSLTIERGDYFSKRMLERGIYMPELKDLLFIATPYLKFQNVMPTQYPLWMVDLRNDNTFYGYYSPSHEIYKDGKLDKLLSRSARLDMVTGYSNSTDFDDPYKRYYRTVFFRGLGKKINATSRAREMIDMYRAEGLKILRNLSTQKIKASDPTALTFGLSYLATPMIKKLISSVIYSGYKVPSVSTVIVPDHSLRNSRGHRADIPLNQDIVESISRKIGGEGADEYCIYRKSDEDPIPIRSKVIKNPDVSSEIGILAKSGEISNVAISLINAHNDVCVDHGKRIYLDNRVEQMRMAYVFVAVFGGPCVGANFYDNGCKRDDACAGLASGCFIEKKVIGGIDGIVGMDGESDGSMIRGSLIINNDYATGIPFVDDGSLDLDSSNRGIIDGSSSVPKASADKRPSLYGKPIVCMLLLKRDLPGNRCFLSKVAVRIVELRADLDNQVSRYVAKFHHDSEGGRSRYTDGMRKKLTKDISHNFSKEWFVPFGSINSVIDAVIARCVWFNASRLKHNSKNLPSDSGSFAIYPSFQYNGKLFCVMYKCQYGKPIKNETDLKKQNEGREDHDKLGEKYIGMTQHLGRVVFCHLSGTHVKTNYMVRCEDVPYTPMVMSGYDSGYVSKSGEGDPSSCYYMDVTGTLEGDTDEDYR